VTRFIATLAHPWDLNKQVAYIATQGASDPGKFRSDAFTGLNDRIAAIFELSAVAPTADVLSVADMIGTGITEWAGPGVSPSDMPGVHGGSVTVTQPPDIYLTINIGQGAGAVVLDDSQLRQLGDATIAAIESCIGAGARVTWLSA
jgi:hypothetical protein